MGRYISKKQNIQEANLALEKRRETGKISTNTPMDEQTKPATSLSLYEPIATKINTQSQKVSDLISSTIKPDEDQTIRAAKMAIANFAANAKKGTKVSAQDLLNAANANNQFGTVMQLLNKL